MKPRTKIGRRVALERALIRLRWFGVLFGSLQILKYTPYEPVHVPGWMRPSSLVVFATLGVLNGTLAIWLRRTRSERDLERAGLAMFVADCAALWAITWIFSFERYGSTWVILYITTLEGALRYQMVGAMMPVVAALALEPLRELYRVGVFGYPFLVRLTTFRLGIMGMVGWAAGAMSGGLQREREEAERRALLLQELAEREGSLRRELSAFHQVLLAGVSRGDLREALQSMLVQIGRDFGYGNLVVLLMEEDGRLHPVAGYGLPDRVMALSLPPGRGIVGAVVESGEPLVVDDVAEDPRYLEVDPGTRSHVSVPIHVGGRVAGVLTSESPALAAFKTEDVARLGRLTAQMTLVIDNARLLTQERAAVERLRELDTMKSDFVAITSHELRTPLTAMQGFIKTLRRPDLDISREEMDEFLTILDRQSDRLSRLVEDLLVVSRIDAGALRLQMETVEVGRLLQEMLEELGPRATRARLAVDPSLPPMVTDGHRLTQIVRNLVENALKFSPDGAPVRLTAVGEGQRLLIEVSDSGTGIPPEELPRIFDRFHQVGGSMRRRSDGFGLGLYIARRLVEALGGMIEVESELGKGTTFKVALPLAPAGYSEIRGTA